MPEQLPAMPEGLPPARYVPGIGTVWPPRMADEMLAARAADPAPVISLTERQRKNPNREMVRSLGLRVPGTSWDAREGALRIACPLCGAPARVWPFAEPHDEAAACEGFCDERRITAALRYLARELPRACDSPQRTYSSHARQCPRCIAWHAAARVAFPAARQLRDEPDAEAGGGAFALLDLDALLDPDRPARRWLWDGLIPEGELVSIVAAGGTGKSLLVLALSVELVRGSADFIGRALTPPQRVLYLDMENSADDWRERLDALGVTRTEVRDWIEAGRFLPLSLPPLRGLDTEAGARQLVELIDRHGLTAGDVLVLDSMQRVTEGDENSADTLRQLYGLTTAELKRRGLTVIRTDNTGKDASKGARGTSGKRDDVGMSWTLDAVPGSPDAFTLAPDKDRTGSGSDSLAFRRGEDAAGVLRFLPVASTGRSTFASQLDAARAALDAASVAHTAGLHAAWDAVQQLPGGVPAGVTRALVRKVQGDRKLAAEAVILP